MRFLIIIFCFVYSGAQSQVIFNHYNSANSMLPNNTVRAIAVEQNNGGWVGTDNGLVYINLSNQMTIYNISNSGIPGNSIRSLYIDAQNNKWIGTFFNGLGMYNDTSWTVYNTFNSDLPDDFVKAINREASGVTWVGTTGGLVRIEDTTWTIYNQFNSNLESSNIASIYIGSDNTKFIGTVNGGLSIITDTSFVTYTLTNSGLPDNTILGIDEDQNGTIWMATPAGGLIGYIGTPTWVVQNTVNSNIASNSLNALVIDNFQSIWIASQTHGLLEKNQIGYNAFSLLPFGVNDDNIFCIDYAPNNTLIWMGTSSDGFVQATINSFLESPSISDAFLEVYPNPFRDLIMIRGIENQQAKYKLFSLEGKLLQEGPVNSTQIRIHQALKNGAYLLLLMQESGMHTQTLIIKTSR